MSKRTPGPWRYGGQMGAQRGYILAGMQTAGEPLGIRRVAVVSQDATLAGGDPEANGALLAAAPDLLAALERMLDQQPFVCDEEECECGPNGNGHDDDGSVCEHIQARRAAAKARGHHP